MWLYEGANDVADDGVTPLPRAAIPMVGVVVEIVVVSVRPTSTAR